LGWPALSFIRGGAAIASERWYARRAGVAEHLESGLISLFDSGIHDWLCIHADHRTGVVRASAEKIMGMCRRDRGALWKIQRSLVKLERIHWIKRFRTPGAHGNYPILIGKYYVLREGESFFRVTEGVTEESADPSPKWYSVNLERTTDWRDVQFDLVTEGIFSSNRARRAAVREPSPSQELIRKKAGDDDDDKETVCVNPADSAPASLNDKQQQWERACILALGNGSVRNPDAYIASVRHKFRKRFWQEWRNDLTRELEKFVAAKPARDKDRGIDYTAQREHLAAYSGRCGMPVNLSYIDDAIHFVQINLGLIEVQIPARAGGKS
jgi:hypothetical protein